MSIGEIDLRNGSECPSNENPLIIALTPYLPRMAQLNRAYFGLQGGEHQAFISSNYSFLVDALSGLDEHSLEPANLFKVFPWIREITYSGIPEDRTTNALLYSNYLRQAIIRVASSLYAIHGIEGDYWRKLPRYYLETGKFPSEVLSDPDGIANFNLRAGEFTQKCVKEITIKRGELPSWQMIIIEDVFGNGRVQEIYRNE